MISSSLDFSHFTSANGNGVGVCSCVAPDVYFSNYIIKLIQNGIKLPNGAEKVASEQVLINILFEDIL